MRAEAREVSHPLFARFYARVAPAQDRGGLTERRRQLLDGLRGRVIELGAGTGLNFAHYPPTVTHVLAVEPEPYFRGLARRAAANAAVPVEVAAGLADGLPARDGAFDAAVVSLVLCSVPDQAVALAELRRVVRTGGELRFLEHVRADSRAARLIQRAVDATVWPRLLGGCHTGRDTVAAINDSGFRLRRVEPFRFPDSRLPLPFVPHVLGVAEAVARVAGARPRRT